MNVTTNASNNEAPRICARGHSYSTEQAPPWLGGRCPTCRAEKKAAWGARRIRMRAGGLQFTVGLAPTLEAAAYTRAKIEREAPRPSRAGALA